METRGTWYKSRPMRLRTLDLFCGAGGSSWGAREAGATIVGGVDTWKLASEVFQENFRRALVVDRSANGRWLDGAFPAFGEIDLVIASPECTNHTCARGARARDEGSRRTALHILRYARLFKPRWLVIENVVHMRRWKGYAPLLEALRRDYQVHTQVLDAADFGIPQTRRRLFILCDQKQTPRHVHIPLNGKHRGVVSEILDAQGTWPSKPLYTKTRASPTIERAERAIKALGTKKPFLIVYYGSDGAGGWQSLERPLRTLTTLDRFGLVEWEGRMPRLRMLQVPELRRAMGWPESFVFDRGTRREKIMMLGNGVCPPVMRAVVSTLVARRSASFGHSPSQR